MRLGAVEYLPGGGDDSERLLSAKRLGFAGVEGMLTRAELRSGERLDSLRRATRETGVAIPSLMLSEHNSGGLASESPDVSEAAAEDVRLAVGWARELGARAVLVPFFFGGEIITDSDLVRAAEGFRELCPLALEAGVSLCYEGTLPAERVREMAPRVGSDAFGCYFDLGNAVWRGLDPATEIITLGDLVRQVHVKDSKAGPGDVRPGLGMVDFGSCREALSSIRYDGWLVLETPPGPMELVARDASFARSVFPDLEPRVEWPVFGAFSYGFGRGEVERLISTWRSLGLGAVQLADGLLAESLEGPESAAGMRSELEAAGIRVAGIAGYRNITSPDAGKRWENLEFLKRCLEIAPHLSTGVVATETGTLSAASDWEDVPGNWSSEAWDAMCEAVGELLETARGSSSVLALEGYVNNVLKTPGQLAGVIERFGSEHLGAVLDPFNYLSSHLLPAQGRVTKSFLDRFEPYFVIAHLKDVGERGAEHDTPELGAGVFEYGPYLEFLRDRRPDLALVLEHLPLEHVPGAIETVRGMIEIK